MQKLSVRPSSQTHLARSINPERCYQWLAIGILGLGLTLRLVGLGKGIWLDEAYSLDRIFSSDFLQQLRLSDHPPLYYILLKLWSQINSSEEFLRVLSVCFGVGTVAVVMKWMKQYSHISSLIAGLICTTLPLMLRYSQEIKGYPLLLFATALSFYSASRLMSKSEGLSGYLGLGFGLTIAVATHAVGIMLLMSICAYIAFTSLAWRKIRLERVVLALIVPLSVFILLFFFFLIKSIDKDPNSWWVPTISGGYTLYLVKALFGVDQARWPFWVLNNMFPVLGNRIVALLYSDLDFIFLSVLLLGGLFWGNWRQSFPLLIAAIVYWGQMFVYSMLVLPIVIDRTTLPGMIPFVGFIALQTATIQKRKLKIGLITGLTLLCLIFTINWIRNDDGKPVEEWGQIAQSLKSVLHPNDVVLMYPDYVEVPLKYYLDLPSEVFLPLSYEFDRRQVGKDIYARLSGSKEDSFNVFLIVRLDANERNQIDDYRQLLTYLESEFGSPILLQQLGELSLSKYEAHSSSPSDMLHPTSTRRGHGASFSDYAHL